MGDPFRLATVHGPADVTSGTPSYVPHRLLSVESFSATRSQTFWADFDFSISSGVGSAPPSTLMRSPTRAPGGGSSSSTTSVPAANTIPVLSTPRILAGFKLHSTTTFLPMREARDMYFASPDTTWRGTASPTSIISTYKLSASGCISADTICPTRMSTRKMSATSAAAGFAFAAFAFSAASFFAASAASSTGASILLNMPSGSGRGCPAGRSRQVVSDHCRRA
mmetsp:Transcript_16532/g.24297  ORF Transcript_16532/g.24297 Transcript_16532/m.24297 type:complete len:224 (+) Transcript_16532:232-903(+)